MSKREPLAFLAALVLIASSACGGGGGGGGESASGTSTAKSSAPAAGGGGSGNFGTASISGKVTFEGTPPTQESINMDADPYCGMQHPGGAKAQEYVVGAAGGLKWVFVCVKEGVTGEYGAPGDAVVLDQHGCAYQPHVFGIMAGQKLKILNSDETLHNIHSLSKESRQFNLAMPRKGMELEQKFRKPELMVRIKCDVHPWMESYAGVLSHPFYSTTDDDGSFRIDRLPAGTYTIEAWHENAGSQTKTVTVADGESKQITFSFKASA